MNGEVEQSVGGEGQDIQWQESYVAAHKTFAKDENIIRRHAESSGFPANPITEIHPIIDPTTAGI